MRFHAASLVVSLAALLTTAACGSDACPAGSIAVGDRCIADDAGANDLGSDDAAADDAAADAATDLGPRDDAAADDAGTADLGLDACVPVAETCNGRDDDCDGSADDGLPLLTHYADTDGDGFGADAGAQMDCAIPAGRVTVAGDCDDTSSSVHPGALEACNTLDDDCDGAIDEGFTTLTHYADLDGDTYGDDATAQLTCAIPAGRITVGGDCDDTNAAVHPTAAEVCNGVDDDCDGMTDEGVMTTFYRDTDGDHFGLASAPIQACTLPGGYAATSGDCNDGASTVHPGATELCNAIDDDCNSVADNGFACVRGASASCTTTCGSTGAGTCTAACALASAASCTPPAETCNSLDDDCDGLLDEGTALTWGSVSDLARPAADQVAIVGNGTFYAALTRLGTSVVVRQLDTTLTPTGTDISVAGDAEAVAMTLNGAEVVVAWAAAGVIYAKRAPLTTLAFGATAATIVDPPGFITAIDVAPSGGNLLFAYVSAQSLYGVRTTSTFTTPTANTLLVAGADLAFRQFDLAPGPSSGWAVAYSDRLAAETDREVFLQAIAASGTALDGALYRTSDAIDQTFPALAYDATSARLAMTWIDGTSVRLNTFQLTGTGGTRAMTAIGAAGTSAAVTVSATVSLPTYLLATPLAVDVSAGTLTVVYAADSVESSRYELATLAASGTGRVTTASGGLTSVGVVTPVGTSGGRPALLPARAVANRTSSTRAFLLGCP